MNALSTVVHSIERIALATDFDAICDRLLPLVVGPMVQTHGQPGADGGVDADYHGTFAGRTGYWVFQYKFRNPNESTRSSQRQLRQALVGRGSSSLGGFKRVLEVLEKEGEPPPVGYILVTNVPSNPAWTRSLRRSWRGLCPSSEFCVWDRARLNTMLFDHPHLAASRSAALADRSRQEVALPAWHWTREMLTLARSWKSRPYDILGPRLVLRGDGAQRTHVDEANTHRCAHADAPQPLHDDAFRFSWRHSLRLLGEAETAASDTVEAALNDVRKVAERIRSADVWVGAKGRMWDKHGYQAALILLGATAAGHNNPIVEYEGSVAHGNLTLIGDCGKSEGEAIVEVLNGTCNWVRQVKGAPTTQLASRWRETHRLVEALANALWYAAELGHDAPRTQEP